MHVHDMDPGGTYGEDNELKIDGCTFENQNAFRTPENELTCPTYFRFLRRVDARSVRLRNTNFTENRARAGGAIFTNNFTMISILPDLQHEPDERFDNSLAYALTENTTQLNRSFVFFEKNSVIDGGYGDRAASTPVTAFLTNLDNGEHQKSKGFTNSSFLSGDRLRFNIEFEDGIGQPVTFADNLTGYISCDEDRSREQRSDCAQLEISGQKTAQANEDGTMNFIAVRLQGFKEQEYTLRIDYRSTSELQTLDVNPSFVNVTMRRCKIGEKTVSEESDYLECQPCGQGEFQPSPEKPVCLACMEPDNHITCDGQTIVPHDGYWHASSFSFVTYECIGYDACRSTGMNKQARAKKLRAIAIRAHEQESIVLYNSSDNDLQCREVGCSPTSSVLCPSFAGISRYSLWQMYEWFWTRRGRLSKVCLSCIACLFDDYADSLVVYFPFIYHPFYTAAFHSH